MIKILRNKLFKHFFPGLITWISELIDTLTLTLQVCSFYLSYLSFYLSSRYRSQTRLQNDDFLTFSAIHSTFWHERTNTIKTNFKKDVENSWNRSPRKKKIHNFAGNFSGNAKNCHDEICFFYMWFSVLSCFVSRSFIA